VAGAAGAAVALRPMLTELLDGWRRDLAAWAIPEEITAAVAESPWVLPRQVFARRADRVRAAPAGPSFQRAWAALDPPGSVLDVGAGAGELHGSVFSMRRGSRCADSSRQERKRLSGSDSDTGYRQPGSGADQLRYAALGTADSSESVCQPGKTEYRG